MNDGLRRSEKHVVWPGLVRASLGDAGFSLYNPGHGTSLDVEEESSELVEAILAGFTSATTLDDFSSRQPHIPEALLVLMARSGFLVEEAELPFLEHGFLRPAPSPVGAPWSWSDLPELAVAGGWVVIGVPTDMGGIGKAGARHGPSEIRKVVNGALLTGEGDVVDYELSRLYPSLQLQVSDLGDVDPEGGRLDHVGARLAKVVRELLERELRPLVLGGDHSITHFVLAEAIEQVPRFGIIHFDAHHDLLPSRSLSHANVFRSAIESPRVEHLVQIGLRSFERVSPYATRVSCAKRRVVSARETAHGGALSVLEQLPRDIPYYLSFDIDCIDATVAPETGAPLLGGLGFEQALGLVDYIARTFELLGADFVEVSAAQTPVNAAAMIAASLLQRCVIGASEFEPLSTDVYVLGP